MYRTEDLWGKAVQTALQRQLTNQISRRCQGRDMCFVAVDLEKGEMKNGEAVWKSDK